MLRASALYIVIVIALVIALLCSSLIAAAYFYQLQYQRTFRYSGLQQNLISGINILLESKIDFLAEQKLSLFEQDNDTVILKRQSWGIYTVGSVRAFVQHDTVSKVFTMAIPIDSSKWSALYIIDEDRNISVSGKTSIKGTAYLPKAGIQEAYVNNQAYEGNKRLVIGDKRNSSRTLPVLDSKVLSALNSASKPKQLSHDSLLLQQDSVHQSFLKPTMTFNFGKSVYRITNKLTGNIILYSDTLITLSSSALLNNIIVFAKAIKVEKGFSGSCQLFATDSISVEANCRFNYPSAIGVINFVETAVGQRKLGIGESSKVNGLVFTYERVKNTLLPVIDLGTNIVLSGQVYSQGLINYKDNLVINGSVHTSRFIYQTAYTRYENYLINVKIDGPALSKYYLGSNIVPVASNSKKILQWLD